MSTHYNTEQLQKSHYDSIASEYGKHYGDKWSQAYRHKFINKPMFENINLSGMKVIEPMCGHGETTGYLLERGAQVTGIDISQEEIAVFRERWPNCVGHHASIFSTGLKSNTYDCVAVVAGLHHVQPNCSKAIKEIHRLLKPGGYFCFMEPHKGSLPDIVRPFWYKYDKFFAKNESAIDLESLKREFSSHFDFIKEEYKGNLAFLFVFNTLILRIPLRLKPIYSSAFIWIESILERIQGKRLSCFVVSQWKKK